MITDAANRTHVVQYLVTSGGGWQHSRPGQHSSCFSFSARL